MREDDNEDPTVMREDDNEDPTVMGVMIMKTLLNDRR